MHVERFHIVCRGGACSARQVRIYPTLELIVGFRVVEDADPYRKTGYVSALNVGAGDPGRNHRFLPALATNAPLAHLLNASRLDSPSGAYISGVGG